MNGKETCRCLKEIRLKIAQENDIDLIVEECTHKGECRGTCPRCEAEVRYLEAALEKRRKAGLRVALAGVSAGLALALSGCAAVDRLADAARGVFITPTPQSQVTTAPQPTMGMPTPMPTPFPDDT